MTRRAAELEPTLKIGARIQKTALLRQHLVIAITGN